MEQLVNRSEMAIRRAITDCLDGCYQSGSPVANLAEYLEELRNSGWDHGSTRRVEVAVLRVLSGVAREVDLATN